MTEQPPPALARALVHLEAVFAADGPLATLMPGYRPRSQQIEMARLVAETLYTRKGRLAIDAGTGTGKSLAYLVPSLLSGLRVVIATGTKALQDQLVEKDAPIAVAAVEAVLARAARRRLGDGSGDDGDGRDDDDGGDTGIVSTLGPVLRLKGRNNYLCKLRYEQFSRQQGFGFDETLVQIGRFAERTTTGDRAEIEGLPDNFPTWKEIDADRNTCLGSSCPKYEDCFVVKLRRSAENAAVIVTNHHLLCADTRLRLEVGDAEDYARVLPKADALIIDEAHALPDVATDHFGLSLSSEDIVRLAIDARRLADGCSGDVRAAIMDALDGVDEASKAFFSHAIQSRERGETGRPRRAERGDAPARQERGRYLASDEGKRLAEAVSATVGSLADALDEGQREVDGDDPDDVMRRAALQGLQDRAGRVRAEISYLAGPASADERFVCFVDQGPKAVSLTSAPIDVAGPLAGSMFDVTTPVVMTSATLAVGDDLSTFLTTVGLLGLPDTRAGDDDEEEDGDSATAKRDPPPKTAVFLSPFDFPKRAALYVPSTMPEPDQPHYQASFDDEALALLKLAGGGALLLFTSHRAMEEAAQRLGPTLSSWGIPVLMQGERPKAVLLQAMRDNGNSALFATASFWEGVDVQGAALRLVIIDRLPFRVPSDPVVRARADAVKKGGADPFERLSVPEAALTLKQGAGRLLRSVDDAGVVAVLDGRIRRRRYGPTLLSALPPMTRIGSRKTVEQFWERFVVPALYGDEGRPA